MYSTCCLNVYHLSEDSPLEAMLGVVELTGCLQPPQLLPPTTIVLFRPEDQIDECEQRKQ